MPMPVFTFLESYNFNWKIIIPFCAHGGSKFGSSISDIKKIRPKAYAKEGLAIRASDVGNAKDEVDVWLSKLGMCFTKQFLILSMGTRFMPYNFIETKYKLVNIN
ncbi:MAG: hypothetical protein LBT58_02200 [Endomicrobium sp.]|jgi:flavodoxin|nr:hypothetical protein [Endomicrobium sp.]